MERRLTVFGATVLELMIKRGVRTWTELAAMLEELGYHYSSGSFSHWSYGRHAAPKTLPGALVEVLGLDDTERTRLGMAFAYGQDERLGEAA